MMRMCARRVSLHTGLTPHSSNASSQYALSLSMISDLEKRRFLPVAGACAVMGALGRAVLLLLGAAGLPAAAQNLPVVQMHGFVSHTIRAERPMLSGRIASHAHLG